jgi:hypothetical protein
MRKSIWIRALQHGLRSPGETLDQFNFQILIEFQFFTHTYGCSTLFKATYGNVSSHSYNCNDYEIENKLITFQVFNNIKIKQTLMQTCGSFNFWMAIQLRAIKQLFK